MEERKTHLLNERLLLLKLLAVFFICIYSTTEIKKWQGIYPQMDFVFFPLLTK